MTIEARGEVPLAVEEQNLDQDNCRVPLCSSDNLTRTQQRSVAVGLLAQTRWQL